MAAANAVSAAQKCTGLLGPCSPAACCPPKAAAPDAADMCMKHCCACCCCGRGQICAGCWSRCGACRRLLHAERCYLQMLLTSCILHSVPATPAEAPRGDQQELQRLAASHCSFLLPRPGLPPADCLRVAQRNNAQAENAVVNAHGSPGVWRPDRALAPV